MQASFDLAEISVGDVRQAGSPDGHVASSRWRRITPPTPSGRSLGAVTALSSFKYGPSTRAGDGAGPLLVGPNPVAQDRQPSFRRAASPSYKRAHLLQAVPAELDGVGTELAGLGVVEPAGVGVETRA